jgi:putative ABC transport system ATP-binding protein
VKETSGSFRKESPFIVVGSGNFSSFNLIPMLYVEENIALPHWLEGISTEQTHTRVEVLMDQLDLTPRRNHRPYELSGGEQQRVA